MEGYEYTIIGYYPNTKSWCLVALAGRNKERALEILRERVENPDTWNGAAILSLNQVKSSTAWWNDPTMLD